jgi:hypothetical protein
MKRTTPIITIIILFAIVASLVLFCTASSFTPQCPLQIMPSRANCSAQEAARRRQDDEAMAAAILHKEKNAAKNDELKAANGDNLTVVVDTNPTQVPLPSVVSPPSALNLTSLLTGHVGQEVGNQVSSDMDINSQDVEQVEDSAKSPKKKKSKKRSGSSLKKSSFATQPVAATSSAKDYKFERVFYEVGLELKDGDKYSAYVKHIGNLLENIQLVNPLAIIHAVEELRGAKPLGSKSEMSTNMTVFLAYAPVGRNTKAFQPKKNNDRRKGRKGKNEPDTLNPSVYPTMVLSSDVDPEIIISYLTHEFGRAGGFYFWKKQLQCEETMTPFIIYFLYTFNDIATLRGELTSLLEEALQGMKDNFTLLDKFKYASLPDINICRGVLKLPGQPGSNFWDYSHEMQEARRAHLIECDIKEIPFLRVLISYIKETPCLHLGRAHSYH